MDGISGQLWERLMAFVNDVEWPIWADKWLFESRWPVIAVIISLKRYK